MTPQKIVGFCGYPKCGKSMAAMILSQRYGTVPVDDAWPLRDFAIRHMGASLEDVTTQAGKARKTVICGQEMSWRAVLGRIGDKFEELYGDAFLPECALRRITDHESVHSFGSVRKTQGLFLKTRGALIVEITREGCVPTATFDEYDRSCVDFTVGNNAGREAFVGEIIRRFDKVLPIVEEADIETYVAEIIRREDAEAGRTLAA